MMWTTLAKLTTLAGLSLSLETGIASAQVFQWTDAKGVIHFTDNPSSIPESIRNSSSLIVRKDLDTRRDSSPATIEDRSVAENPSPTSPADADAWQTTTTVMTDTPEEVSIVVVNPNLAPPHLHPCKFRSDCKPSFRPDFTDRRYIHPSVFDRGLKHTLRPGSHVRPKSRPLTHGRDLPRPGRAYPRAR